MAHHYDLSTFEHYSKNDWGHYTLEDVGKHNKKGDIWVTVNGLVIDLSTFTMEHPGGEMVMLAFAGKDASSEFNTIHPAHVLEAFVHDRVIGELINYSAEKSVRKVAPSSERKGQMPGLPSWFAPKGQMNHFMGWVWALIYMAYYLIFAIAMTIFSVQAFTINKDRKGLTRSAMFMIFFVFVHALGNMHLMKGPDDFNGYGYFFVRLYFPKCDFNAVELYLAMALTMHISVGLKRAWGKRSMGIASGQLNLAITGLMILTFLMKHFQDFRFGDTAQFGPYYVRAPPYIVNYQGLLKGDLFWDYDKSIIPSPTRNIYLLEYQIFSSAFNSVFYIVATIIFMTHACIGWKNAVPVLGIPRKDLTTRIRMLGYVLILLIGSMYLAFPVYCNATDPYHGEELDIQTADFYKKFQTK